MSDRILIILLFSSCLYLKYEQMKVEERLATIEMKYLKTALVINDHADVIEDIARLVHYK